MIKAAAKKGIPAPKMPATPGVARIPTIAPRKGPRVKPMAKLIPMIAMDLLRLA